MNVVTMLMLTFAVLGGLDRIFGNRFGLGKEFDKGFMLLGNMALSMIGMIVISPLIADLLQPCFAWVYATLGIDPSIIPASLFANDMGGAPLAKEVAQNGSIGMYNALVVSSMMGCTISFTVPYALGVVKKECHRELFLGLLCGIVTIPIGCFISGFLLGIPVLQNLFNLLPLIVFSAVIACGLIFAPEFSVKCFSVLGLLIKALVTVGLLLGMFEFLTGIALVKGLADIMEGADICFNAAVVLAGAFPFMHVVSYVLKKPLAWFGGRMKISAVAATGLLSTIVTNATTLEMMNRMDKKGALLNASFAVSAAFTLGGHLAFTMAFDAAYIVPVIVAKLLSGIPAVVLASIVYKRLYREQEFI
ncbi:MAG: ethanolamine utilization protein EutH [Clostridia bacterium]|nr:ethanolamine utilization protein EutH [Clostridia bacterium]